jgi:zinc protease
MFWAAAAPRAKSDTATVERALVGEIEKLASEPVSGEELDRARRQLEISLLLGRQTARDRGQALGTSQVLTGDWSNADRQLQQLRALTPADLQRAAARTLTPARRTVVWMTPRAAGAGSGGQR